MFQIELSTPMSSYDYPLDNYDTAEQYADYLAEFTPLTEPEARLHTADSLRIPTGKFLPNTPGPKIAELRKSLQQKAMGVRILNELWPTINPDWSHAALYPVNRLHYQLPGSQDGDEMRYLVLHRSARHPDQYDEFTHEYYLTEKHGDWYSPTHETTTTRTAYNNPIEIIDTLLDTDNIYERTMNYIFLHDTPAREELIDPTTYCEEYTLDQYALAKLLEHGLIRAKTATTHTGASIQTLAKYAANHKSTSFPNHLSYDADTVLPDIDRTHE